MYLDWKWTWTVSLELKMIWTGPIGQIRIIGLKLNLNKKN